MLWHIGNTTVRTPYRLRDALLALKESQFHGNLSEKEQEEGFARLLNEKKIVRGDRITSDPEKDSSDLGRKWRIAMGQLGFMYLPLDKSQKQTNQSTSRMLFSDFPTLPGKPYQITPNGERSIQAETFAEQQECFLRSLVAYRIPSVFETRYKCPPFSPLRFVLEILLLLEKNGKEGVIEFEEMAYIVQLKNPSDEIERVVSGIIQSRESREKAPSKRKYDNEIAQKREEEEDVKAGTLIDYADLNFRYLKATGLFVSNGRGIGLLSQKRPLIEILIAEKSSEFGDIEYVEQLWKGAALPTDNKEHSVVIISNLIRQLEGFRKKPVLPPIASLSEQELTSLRYNLEEELRSVKELEYAGRQKEEWSDIANIMAGLKDSKKSVELETGERFKIPDGEAPAYFEWIVWRAFLAINSLVNMPWEARKFKVDQDFLPVSHAPSRVPDMLFEYRDFVLVVEVTLTSNSRQEAAEGEPVRRHVAEIAEKFEQSGKRVYCLFLAPYIDSNTAETFKIGTWYKKDDTRLPLHIVPLMLEDFIEMLKTKGPTDEITPEKFQRLLISCRALSNMDAPSWKKEIKEEIKTYFLERK